MQRTPKPGWMHVDTQYTEVCALCCYWNDVTEQHLAVSNTPHHVYYDAYAREFCKKQCHDTYGGQPACPFFSKSV